MKSICVFGVFVADLCFVGDSIPSKGQTILGKKHIIGPGGKGSNQAIASARLGGNVNFITKVGKDENAKMALSLYKEIGINTNSIIQDHINLTGVAGIMINEKTGDNAINIIPGAAGTITKNDIENNSKFIEDSEIFLTQLETPYEATSYALKKAKETGSITIFNPAPASEILKQDFEMIDFFTPNETEAGYYLEEKVETDEEIKKAGDSFLKKGVKNIIITLGSRGVYFANSNENYFIEVFKLKDQVIDTTGAGDTFAGAYLHGLEKGTPFLDNVENAVKIASRSTSYDSSLGLLLENLVKFD